MVIKIKFVFIIFFLPIAKATIATTAVVTRNILFVISQWLFGNQMLLYGYAYVIWVKDFNSVVYWLWSAVNGNNSAKIKRATCLETWFKIYIFLFIIFVVAKATNDFE